MAPTTPPVDLAAWAGSVLTRSIISAMLGSPNFLSTPSSIIWALESKWDETMTTCGTSIHWLFCTIWIWYPGQRSCTHYSLRMGDSVKIWCQIRLRSVSSCNAICGHYSDKSWLKSMRLKQSPIVQNKNNDSHVQASKMPHWGSQKSPQAIRPVVTGKPPTVAKHPIEEVWKVQSKLTVEVSSSRKHWPFSLFSLNVVWKGFSNFSWWIFGDLFSVKLQFSSIDTTCLDLIALKWALLPSWNWPQGGSLEAASMGCLSCPCIVACVFLGTGANKKMLTFLL